MHRDNAFFCVGTKLLMGASSSTLLCGSMSAMTAKQQHRRVRSTQQRSPPASLDHQLQHLLLNVATCFICSMLIYATCQCSSQQGLLQHHEYLRRLYICLQEYVQCWSATGKSLLHPTEMLCKHLPVAVAAHTKIIEACPTISDPQQYYQHHAPANRNHTQHIHLQQ